MADTSTIAGHQARERGLAAAAHDPAIVAIHRDLAGHHRQLILAGEASPPLRT